jgi:hypothetical protein
MKTHIIRLASHDDATSIRDKMSWSKGGRILLAFPKRRPPFLKIIDLNLLLRKTAQLGGQLAFVSRDREIIANAADLGIPVFSSIPEAQRLPWIVPRRRKRFVKRDSLANEILAQKEDIPRVSRVNSPQWARLLIFAFGLSGLFVLIMFFIPSAQILIVPQRIQEEMVLNIWANSNIPGPFANGGMPATYLTITVEGSIEGEGSAVVTVPDKFATGNILLTNLTDSPVDVPVGTVFLKPDDPIARFISIQPISVSGGVGKTATVAVKAETAGVQGVVSSNTIQAVEGQVGLSISATNPEPTEGGSDRNAQAASEQDYERLYDVLITSLSEEALQKMEIAAGEDAIVVQNSLKLNNVLQNERAPSVGEPTDIINLTLRLEYSVLTINESDVEAVARLALDAGMQEGYHPVSENIDITNITDPILDENNNARWEVKVSRIIETNWDSQSLLAKISGRPIEEAEYIINDELKLNEKAIINLKPSWWSRIPFVPLRITIVEL